MFYWVILILAPNMGKCHADDWRGVCGVSIFCPSLMRGSRGALCYPTVEPSHESDTLRTSGGLHVNAQVAGSLRPHVLLHPSFRG